MRIHGLQKMTLLDYPGNVACTVFSGGCNMRCPFCHNAPLVTHLNDTPLIDENEVLSFLSTRKGLLDGVCFTGGEPLLQPDIASFIKKVRAFGYKIKLDTNGTFPDKLEELVGDGLIDYVAIDIKNTFEKYPETVGIKNFDVTPVKRSIDFLMKSDIEYEFRTTVVKEFHTVEDIEKIAEYIKGSKGYFLQNFTDSGDLIGDNLHPHDKGTMYEMLEKVQKYVNISAIRGI